MSRQYGYRARPNPPRGAFLAECAASRILQPTTTARTAPSHNILKNCGKIALENTPQSLLRSFYARSFRAAIEGVERGATVPDAAKHGQNYSQKKQIL